MRATIGFVTEKFREFNHQIFADTLPVPTLGIFHARRRLGELRYPLHRDGHMPEPREYELRITDRIDMEQAVVEDTLIHEMIHLYIHVNRIQDTSQHGQAFRRLAEAINRRHGRNITVTHRLSDEEKQSDAHMKWHRMAVVTFTDSHKAICVCASTRIFDIHRQLQGQSNVAGWTWHVSYDPFFNDYPASRRLAYYRISPEDIAGHVFGEMSREFVCDGRTFRMKNSI